MPKKNKFRNPWSRMFVSFGFPRPHASQLKIAMIWHGLEHQAFSWFMESWLIGKQRQQKCGLARRAWLIYELTFPNRSQGQRCKDLLWCHRFWSSLPFRIRYCHADRILYRKDWRHLIAGLEMREDAVRNERSGTGVVILVAPCPEHYAHHSHNFGLAA